MEEGASEANADEARSEPRRANDGSGTLAWLERAPIGTKFVGAITALALDGVAPEHSIIKTGAQAGDPPESMWRCSWEPDPREGGVQGPIGTRAVMETVRKLISDKEPGWAAPPIVPPELPPTPPPLEPKDAAESTDMGATEEAAGGAVSGAGAGTATPSELPPAPPPREPEDAAGSADVGAAEDAAESEDGSFDGGRGPSRDPGDFESSNDSRDEESGEDESSDDSRGGESGGRDSDEGEDDGERAASTGSVSAGETSNDDDDVDWSPRLRS